MNLLVNFGLILISTITFIESLHTVKYLTANEFKKTVQNLDSIWVFGYDTMKMSTIDPNLPFYNALAIILKGIAYVGIVQSPLLGMIPNNEMKDKNKPFVRIYVKNTDGTEPGIYSCHGEVTEKNIVMLINNITTTLLIKRLNSKVLLKNTNEEIDGIRKLTYASFENKVLKSNKYSLVYFFTPWSERCKIFKLQWKIAVKRLKDKVEIHLVDASVYNLLSEKYNVIGYPTVKLFKDQRSMEYTGKETANDIELWVLKIINAKPINLIQIIDQDTFYNYCQISQLCIITILPKLYQCDSNCRNNYLGMLSDVSKDVTKPDWKWVWAEAESQPDLESTLTMGDFDYPELAVVNFTSLTYTLWREPFIEVAIRDFFNEILTPEIMEGTFLNNIQIITISKWIPKNNEKSHQEL